MRKLTINRPTSVVGSGVGQTLPAANEFLDCQDVDCLVVAVKNLDGTNAKNVTLDLADKTGRVFATTAPISVAANATRAIVIGSGVAGLAAGTLGLNVDPVAVEVPPKVRVNVASSAAGGSEVTVYGRGDI